jgi:hypothetical protein
VHPAPVRERREAIRFLNGADGFDKGTVFGPDERLIFSTLEDLEVPLWEVFNVLGSSAEKVPVNEPPDRSIL